MANNWVRWKNVMKAVPFEEKRLLKWEPPYIVQPKYDGVRCRMIPTDAGCLLLSSEENVIYSVPHLNEMFNELEIKWELDGELYCHSLTFEAIESRTSRTVNLHSHREDIQFHCFDIISDELQAARTTLLNSLDNLSPWLQVAPFWLCYNLDDVMRVYDKILSQGYEGIIVRHYLNKYVRKRSTFVMKFKPKKEDSYEIEGFTEEVSKEGVLKDTLGSLICKSGDGQTFKVGTGFTEERRKEIWEAQDILKGSLAKVKYQHTTAGRGVPRFPVFVEIEVRT